MSRSKLLLHVCCGPCAVGAHEALENEGWDITNLFYNPNIHPFDEYYRRQENFFIYLLRSGQKGLAPFPYHPREYFQKVPFAPERCLSCYRLRIERVAEWGKKNGFHFFTTTLTISPYQNQKNIFLVGEQIAQDYDMVFLKKDFQPFYRSSIVGSKKLNLYRQNYCGCLFSLWEGEKKRLWRSLPGQK